MSAPRKFDHDHARRLRKQGWTYQAIADRFGVTDVAVMRVCDPHVRLAMDERSRMSFEHVCHYCGERAAWNKWSEHHHPVPRCRACADEQRATTVRPDALLCSACRQWKWDTEFHHNRSEPQRRGRHQVCRACDTAQRRERRNRSKVPCTYCGTLCLPPSEKTTRGAKIPRCRDCFYKVRRGELPQVAA